jgi:hypothetical protein
LTELYFYIPFYATCPNRVSLYLGRGGFCYLHVEELTHCLIIHLYFFLLHLARFLRV